MPTNTINWGQGAASNSIGWGAGASNNNINWGKIHAESYGHDETNLVGDPYAAYRQAVEADGGQLESRECVKTSFDALNAITIELLAATEAYQTAVVADSGSLESFFCTRQSFIELNNVAV